MRDAGVSVEQTLGDLRAMTAGAATADRSIDVDELVDGIDMVVGGTADQAMDVINWASPSPVV